MAAITVGSKVEPVTNDFWLTLCALWTAGQGSGADETSAAVGNTATLSAAGSRDVLVFSWYRGTAVVDTQRIFSYTVSSAIQYSGPQYTGREVGRPDGSLQIRELLTNYTGYYTVIATHTDGRIVRVTRQLRVYDAIGAVGENVTLLASASLSLLTFSWYRGPVVTPRELIFSYIVSTSTQNNGPQYTGAERGRADGSLQIRDLLINHTGEYSATTILHDGSLTTGTRRLRVYVPLQLPSEYRWNRLARLSESVLLQSVVFAGTFKNKNNTEVVSSPTVRVSTQYPVEDVDSAVLTCETSIPVDTILWSFDHRPLAGDVRMQLSADNRTLTLSSVCRADSGLYQCEARNPVGAGVSAPQTLTVVFGPEKAELEPSGCRIIEAGAVLTLTCSAESAPTAEYQWLLNKRDLNHSDSRLIVPKVSASGDGGRYTCVTRNQLTGRSVNASVSIAVLGE
ncbi:cell adhesion molecule CEACAM6-like [Lissotriton helveticus]